MLRRTSAGSLAIVLASAGLTACSSSGKPSAGGSSGPVTTSPSPGGSGGTAASTAGGPSAPSAGGSGLLPSYLPYAGVKPDIPAAKHGMEYFFTYPDPPINAVPTKPLPGGAVTAMSPLSVFTPLPMAKNRWWQNINAQLGGAFDVSMTPAADYTARFTTTVAGGKLPELVRVPSVPNMDQVLAAEFADLTEHLSGDAVKAYPMLANIPTATWQSAVFDGAIRGVPMTLSGIFSYLYARQDIFDTMGLSLTPASAAEFMTLCSELTDANKKHWAMVQPINDFTKEMCGVPNIWAVADGKFTKDLETGQFKDWLSYTKTMWDKGLFHPDSFSNPQVATLFKGGQYYLFAVGGGFVGAMHIYTPSLPNLKMSPMVPPKFSGGGNAPTYLGPGNNGITAINKHATADRVKILLSTLNFLAGPFGTTQYLDTQFGVKDYDYKWEAGQGPVPQPVGNQEKIMANYFPGAPPVGFEIGYTDTAKAQAAYDATVSPDALDYPTLGLYSPTNTTKGATLTTMITAACGDVIQGHKPLSAWDGIVKSWRDGGGDTIRSEYEKQYAASHS